MNVVKIHSSYGNIIVISLFQCSRFTVIPVSVTGCEGRLRLYADGALMYDSELWGDLAPSSFDLPATLKKLSVICNTNDPATPIVLTSDTLPRGETWRCKHVNIIALYDQ